MLFIFYCFGARCPLFLNYSKSQTWPWPPWHKWRHCAGWCPVSRHTPKYDLPRRSVRCAADLKEASAGPRVAAAVPRPQRLRFLPMGLLKESMLHPQAKESGRTGGKHPAGGRSVGPCHDHQGAAGCQGQGPQVHCRRRIPLRVRSRHQTSPTRILTEMKGLMSLERESLRPTGAREEDSSPTPRMMKYCKESSTSR